jgi:hypothetical protein
MVIEPGSPAPGEETSSRLPERVGKKQRDKRARKRAKIVKERELPRREKTEPVEPGGRKKCRFRFEQIG